MIAYRLARVLGARGRARLITSHHHSRIIGPARVSNKGLIGSGNTFGLFFLISGLSSAKVVWSRHYQVGILPIQVITRTRRFKLFQVISVR